MDPPKGGRRSVLHLWAIIPFISLRISEPHFLTKFKFLPAMADSAALFIKFLSTA